MSAHSNKKRLFLFFSVATLVISGTLIVSFFARGYRLNLGQGPILKATGLLSATSRPKGASVYINDRLFTATDDTINLPPGNYAVKILKDGYLPWQKNLEIKKEIVFQTNAELFRSVPELRPLSLSGAINPALSPDMTKAVFAVASASASKDNGLYLVEFSSAIIPLARSTPRLIAPNLSTLDWTKAEYQFSPNSRQILATFKNASYLLNLDSPIDSRQLYDVTARLSLIQEEWQQQQNNSAEVRFARLPKEIKPYISTTSATLLSYNSDDDKILFLATKDGTLPGQLLTPPPAQSTQAQSRNLVRDHYYVYDLQDDTNYLLGPNTSFQSPFWLPGSNNIIYLENQSLKVCDYDSTNRQTIFTGQFNHFIVAPWADGSQLITITSPYTGAPENFYSISLK